MTARGAGWPGSDGRAAPLESALAVFAACASVVVALDFDGTLAELADDPQTVRTSPQVRGALAILGADRGVLLALVSGRPVGDLGRLAAPPPGTVLIGSHGAELAKTASGSEAVLVDGALDNGERLVLREVTMLLERIAREVPGAWVEHKPLAAVLHTRLAPVTAGQHALARALDSVSAWPGTHIINGKDVVEVSVRATTKADAIESLRARAATATGRTPGRPAGHVPLLFAGDDLTDESAFAALVTGDVGIKVGAGTTSAAYRVTGPAEFGAVLQLLARLRVGRRRPDPGPR